MWPHIRAVRDATRAYCFRAMVNNTSSWQTQDKTMKSRDMVTQDTQTRQLECKKPHCFIGSRHYWSSVCAIGSHHHADTRGVRQHCPGHACTVVGWCGCLVLKLRCSEKQPHHSNLLPGTEKREGYSHSRFLKLCLCIYLNRGGKERGKKRKSFTH